jgi:flagellar assembly protein FliH
MDAVIRSAQLAPSRTRLSEAGAPEQAGHRDDIRSPQDEWKSEIERQVRAELASQAQAIYEDSRKRGHAEGHAAGLAAAHGAAAGELQQAREQLRTRVDSVLSAMERAHAAALRNLQSSVGEVAFAAICRLMGDKAASQALVLRVVEHVCAQSRIDAVATVRLHPRDMEGVTTQLQADGNRIQSAGLKLVADPSLQLGGCVIESAAGHYDGGLESQLRRLHAILTSTAVTEAEL